jgi:hypothetical protein
MMLLHVAWWSLRWCIYTVTGSVVADWLLSNAYEVKDQLFIVAVIALTLALLRFVHRNFRWWRL